MTNRWLKGVAVAALTAAGIVAAQAADLPTRKEAPFAVCCVPRPSLGPGSTSAVTSAAFSLRADARRRCLPRRQRVSGQTTSRAELGSGQSGVLLGGQAGYNWQSGAFVLGAETDFDWSSISKSFNFVSSPFAGVGVPGTLLGDTLSVNAKASFDWLGTTRARVGFVATPDNRLMFYGTGGIAYGGGSANFSVFDATTGSVSTGNPSSTRVGWTIGAGAEYAITNNITIKGEYLYYNLGSTTISTTGDAFALANFPGVYANAKYTYDGGLPRRRQLQVLSV